MQKLLGNIRCTYSPVLVHDTTSTSIFLLAVDVGGGGGVGGGG